MASLKILMVEDEPHYRVILKKLLSKFSSLEIDEVENGQAGLDLAKSKEFDLILSDVNMPIMDGIEMLECLRNENVKTPLIFVTALEDSSRIINAFRLGAINVLKKPYEIKQVSHVIKKFLDQKEKASKPVENINKYQERSENSFHLPTKFELIAVVSKMIKSVMNYHEKTTESDLWAVNLALYEIMHNAMMHGNLEISYEDERVIYEKGMIVEDLIKERQKDLALASRKVKFWYEITPEKISIRVIDEGNGFDYNGLPDPRDPENLFLEHGRGVLMTRLQMTKFEYIGKGNEVYMERSFGQD